MSTASQESRRRAGREKVAPIHAWTLGTALWALLNGVMRMKYLSMSALVIGVVACSSTKVREDVGSASQPIMYGSVDTTHDAVVFLYSQKGASGYSCTGTFVKVDTTAKVGWILTAAHCVTNPPKVAVQGQDIEATSALQYNVIDSVAHPSYSSSDTSSPYDVAIVRVWGANASTPTLPLLSADGAAVGSSVTSVGYGRTETSTDTNPNTTRRYVNKTLSAVSSTHIGYSLSSSGICQGDSGGPVLKSEKVIGVHSFVSGGCTTEGGGVGYSVRVQNMYSWISSQLALAAPVASGCESCKSISTSGTNTCAQYYSKCTGDAACKAVYECAAKCTTSACWDTCASANPSGEAVFYASVYCTCNRDCVSECKSECSGTPKCGKKFTDNISCGVCQESQCCSEALACADDQACYSCWKSGDKDASCASNAKRKAMLSCKVAKCASDCNLSSGDGGTTNPDPDGGTVTPDGSTGNPQGNSAGGDAPAEGTDEQPGEQTVTTSSCSTTPASNSNANVFGVFGMLAMIALRGRRITRWSRRR